MLKLKIRDYDELLIVDPRDWDNAKNQRWQFVDGDIVNQAGVSYDKVFDMEGYYNMWHKLHDKRHKFMIPVHMEYVYSEYHGHFILRERKRW